MPILNLGVIDQPYMTPPGQMKAPKHPARAAKKVRGRRGGGGGSLITTGDVATILEEKYHILEHFMALHGQEVADDIAGSVKNAIESIFQGAPLTLDPFGGATSKIEDRMKQMLSLKELDAIGYPGIPTHAAQMGYSKRFKQPRKRRQPRPSFIDTGLMQASYKAWVTTS